MSNEAQKKHAFDLIRDNIARTGHHIYIVSGGATPRFAYTIGLSETAGVELIFAGGILYLGDEVTRIINDIAGQLKAERDQELLQVDGLGSFTLRNADRSWAEAIMLGVFDYYQKMNIPALQVVPDKAHWTIDVPDMRVAWDATKEPVWRWLHEPWTYPVPRDATAATNLSALQGEQITEVMRWDEDEWEVFAGAGPDVTEDEMRVVPLGTLIGADQTLLPAVNLAIGEGLWRDADPDSEWHPWRKREQVPEDDATETSE